MNQLSFSVLNIELKCQLIICFSNLEKNGLTEILYIH